MDEPLSQWMGRAAALTRDGRLIEATRLIQERLAPRQPKAPEAAVAQRPTSKPNCLDGIGALVKKRVLAEDQAVEIVAAPVDRHAEFESASHQYAGLTRRYKLFVPSCPARSPMLVVMLHGCTQDPDDFAVGTGINEHAERDGFLVLYPQQSRSDNPSACWNWFNRKDQRRDGGEAGFLANLVRTIVERHHVDPGRVYVAGLSAGGAMAEILASEYPELFAAAAIHSGLPAGAASNVPDALNAMRSGRTKPSTAPRDTPVVPTIVFHGDTDSTVHPANGENVVQAVLGRSKRPTTREAPSVGASQRYTRTRYLLDDGSALVEQWVLHGAGHAWAGGCAQGSYTDPKGIDATDRLLHFFGEHRR